MDIIFGIILLLAPIIGYGWFFRRLKTIHKRSTTDLQLLTTTHGGLMMISAVIEELKKRNEDYSMALPTLIDRAIHGNQAMRMVAWSNIAQYFPEVGDRIDYDHKKPSQEALNILAGIVE